MNTSGSGGFLFNAIKVYDDPTASSVLAQRHHPKRQKREISAEDVKMELSAIDSVSSEPILPNSEQDNLGGDGS